MASPQAVEARFGSGTGRAARERAGVDGPGGVVGGQLHGGRVTGGLGFARGVRVRGVFVLRQAQDRLRQAQDERGWVWGKGVCSLGARKPLGAGTLDSCFRRNDGRGGLGARRWLAVGAGGRWRAPVRALREPQDRLRFPSARTDSGSLRANGRAVGREVPPGGGRAGRDPPLRGRVGGCGRGGARAAPIPTFPRSRGKGFCSRGGGGGWVCRVPAFAGTTGVGWGRGDGLRWGPWIPASAGMTVGAGWGRGDGLRQALWIPAFAGMTEAASG